MHVVVVSDMPRRLPGWTEAFGLLDEAGFEVTDLGEACENVVSNEAVRTADALLVGLNPVDRPLLEAAKQTRVVAKAGIGVDNVDVAAATDLGIPVCNTPGSNAETVADHAVALMLAWLRNVRALDDLTRSGHGWDDWPYVGGELFGKTIAVVGTGGIGSGVIRRTALGFRVRVYAHDLNPNSALEQEYGVRYGALDEILPLADIVTVHVPRTPASRHLIGAREFALMKPTALLVNTSRGDVVEEAALVDALERGAIAGAALDVFEEEPCLGSELFRFPQVVVTPHVAGFSPEAGVRVRVRTAENLIAALTGTPRDVVNPEVASRPTYRLT